MDWNEGWRRRKPRREKSERGRCRRYPRGRKETITRVLEGVRQAVADNTVTHSTIQTHTVYILNDIKHTSAGMAGSVGLGNKPGTHYSHTGLTLSQTEAHQRRGAGADHNHTQPP